MIPRHLHNLSGAFYNIPMLTKAIAFLLFVATTLSIGQISLSSSTQKDISTTRIATVHPDVGTSTPQGSLNLTGLERTASDTDRSAKSGEKSFSSRQLDLLAGGVFAFSLEALFILVSGLKNLRRRK